jgi:DNA gyrase subunit B
MAAIIEAGHLYIAQPPLYRVKRGNAERYLKNDPQLEDYLIASGLDDARLVGADGSVAEGEALAELVNKARQASGLIHALERRLPAALVEAAVLAGALAEAALVEQASGQGFAQRIADRLSQISNESWRGARAEDGALEFVRRWGERQERFRLDPQIARSPEARRLVAAMADLLPIFQEPAILERKSTETSLPGPLALLEALLAHGRRGLSIQRYKGLGEMNPGQLWETTLDPEVRSLYQVKVEHADEAGKIFETLMGDVVEPRREFIQDNALKVVNLDV